jgi:PmbA protein
MGSSVSLTTGDYSRGAAGFWIENGQITWPAAEATIAGNLKDIFMSLTPANDSDKRQSISAPSLRVDSMMVAGS